MPAARREGAQVKQRIATPHSAAAQGESCRPRLHPSPAAARGRQSGGSVNGSLNEAGKP